jgi:hypothetical protein
MYITPTVDEKVIIRDAENKSKTFGPYIVHYHGADEVCGQFKHRTFIEGREI